MKKRWGVVSLTKVGLVINPIAGMGGRVGLKGTDGAETLRAARERGAVALAGERAVACLAEAAEMKERFELVTASGAMGEDAALRCGFSPHVVYESPKDAESSAADTASAVSKMLDAGAELILFAGGDGTARDVCGVVGESCLALGIPAGVKIHSAVFASSPVQAGRLLADFVSDSRARRSERTAEVMDIDEDAYRSGVLRARLYGYMRMPYERSRVQGLKSGTPTTDAEDQASMAAMASELIEAEPETLWLIGAGTTTRAVMTELGLSGTLLGVDALSGGAVIANDIGEREILALMDKYERTKIVITPIGGQGFLFGRGSQQFSPSVIRRVGRDSIMILASRGKLLSLDGEPLLVDTGDSALDRELEGYSRVIISHGQYFIYRIKAV